MNQSEAIQRLLELLPKLTEAQTIADQANNDLSIPQDEARQLLEQITLEIRPRP
jgi:hypothetical protein